MLRPRDESASNEAMINELVAAGALQVPECIDAFMAVDRRHFWVHGSGATAYVDMPLRDGKLHQSAPHIYAQALEALMPLCRGMSFLNVGSGTGYFSSVVSELTGPEAANDGVDLWPENVAHASERCGLIGKTGIEFTSGNIYQLGIDHCVRYDRIYVGACLNARSKYLYRLLEVGGVLVGPFKTGRWQQLRRVVRESETHFATEVLTSVQFSCLVEPVLTVEPETPLSSSVQGAQQHCGLRGVPFTFTMRERLWALERAASFPASYRSVARAVLGGRARDAAKPCLPAEVWQEYVLPFCGPRSFERLALAAPPRARAAPPLRSAARVALASLAGGARGACGICGAAKRALFLGRGRLGSGISDASAVSTRASGASGLESSPGSSRSGSFDCLDGDGRGLDVVARSSAPGIPAPGAPAEEAEEGEETEQGEEEQRRVASRFGNLLFESLGVDGAEAHAIGSQEDPDYVADTEEGGPNLVATFFDTRPSAAPPSTARAPGQASAGRAGSPPSPSPAVSLERCGRAAHSALRRWVGRRCGGREGSQSRPPRGFAVVGALFSRRWALYRSAE